MTETIDFGVIGDTILGKRGKGTRDDVTRPWRHQLHEARWPHADTCCDDIWTVLTERRRPCQPRLSVPTDDEAGTVIDCVSNLRPWRMRLPKKGTAGVLELPAGTLAASHTSLGHRVILELGRPEGAR